MNQTHRRWVAQWVSLGSRFLPFADAASADLPLSRLLRLSLFQISFGMAVVMLVGTLNRVMIVELKVPAALVAGVNLALAPDTPAMFQKAGMLAPDGRCKTFSKDADGYGRGEGIGMIFLKRLSEARRDGDAVYAIVAELGGTWSAEHGIGRMLLKEMQQYKSPVELKLMRAIKATLDPQGLFNPGKVLPA